MESRRAIGKVGLGFPRVDRLGGIEFRKEGGFMFRAIESPKWDGAKTDFAKAMTIAPLIVVKRFAFLEVSVPR